MQTISRVNGWEKIAKGTMAITIDKNNAPKRVIVRRSLFSKHFSDLVVKINEPIYENEDNMVVLVYEKLPFVKHNNVVFEY